MENNLEKEDLNSSESASEHEEQESVEFDGTEVRRSTRERQPPVWDSEYVTKINIA